MTKHLLTSALFAGVVTGLIAAMFQFYFVIPLLLEGELYEAGMRVHFAIDGSPQSPAQAPGLGTDLGRHMMTLTFNIVTYTGYGLMLVALYAFAKTRSLLVTPRQGITWGLAGFFAVQLAPALGLPPELPGTLTPEVFPRQIWWAGTIVTAAVGLGLIAFGRGFAPLLGIALLVAPHVIGAPHLNTYWGVAPPELSAHFVTRSLGAALAGWAFLGFFTAYFWNRLDPEQ